MITIVMMWSVLVSQLLRMFYAYDVGRHLRVTPTMAASDITANWLPSEPATFMGCHKLPPSTGWATHDGCQHSAAGKQAAIGCIFRCCETWLEWRLALLSHRFRSDLCFFRYSLPPPLDDLPAENGTANYVIKSSRDCPVAPTRISLVSSGSEPVGTIPLEKDIPSINFVAANNFGLEDIKFGTRSPTSNSKAIEDCIAPPTERKKRDPETPRKFACPFLKHDPEKYRKLRPCAWTGWSSVHRVK